SNLLAIIKNHATKSSEAWKAAGNRETQKKKATKKDIANQSIGETPVADLSYAPGLEIEGKSDLEARRSLMQEVSELRLSHVLDPAVDKKAIENAAQEKSVVMEVHGLRGNAMWLPYPATALGSAETLVNHQHSWVAEAYAAAEDDPIVTLVLHQLL